MNTKQDYDVIIAGAGSMGMAAGYYIAKQGISVLLIDAYDPPHGQGSHHGDTRIIRHAYGEGRQYVSLALKAQSLWEDLERESGNKLFERTGVLGIGHKDSAFIKETVESAELYSLPLEVLTSEEVHQRWQGFKIPKDFSACFEPDSGVLYSQACLQTYKDLALKHGANLLTDTLIENIQGGQGNIHVQTNQGNFTGKKVIVSTGAWTSKILKSLNLPLQPVRKVFGWFEPENNQYVYPDFPAFFFDLNDRLYYGFPSIRNSGVKIGRHDSGLPVDPDEINREFNSMPSDENDLRYLLDRHMPGASGRLKEGKVCIYTRTPDEHFIIDHHPKNENIILTAGFSGHGFKFSSVVGEILSELAVKNNTKHDISLFSLSRF